MVKRKPTGTALVSQKAAKRRRKGEKTVPGSSNTNTAQGSPASSQNGSGDEDDDDEDDPAQESGSATQTLASLQKKGRIQSKSRQPIPDDMERPEAGEYQELCVRCAKELGLFPDLVCWRMTGEKQSSKCADCYKKGKACEKLPAAFAGENGRLHELQEKIPTLSGEALAKACRVFVRDLEMAMRAKNKKSSKAAKKAQGMSGEELAEEFEALHEKIAEECAELVKEQRVTNRLLRRLVELTEASSENVRRKVGSRKGKEKATAIEVPDDEVDGSGEQPGAPVPE